MTCSNEIEGNVYRKNIAQICEKIDTEQKGTACRQTYKNSFWIEDFFRSLGLVPGEISRRLCSSRGGGERDKGIENKTVHRYCKIGS
jgi:hypothetical protein